MKIPKKLKGDFTMKKVISAFLATVLLVGMIFTLASCNISESYAEKINKAAEADEHYTYEEVLEDLGDDAVVIGGKTAGVIIAVKGCTSLDDIKAKLDAGDEVEGIVISIFLGKATGAVYKSITEDDLK